MEVAYLHVKELRTLEEQEVLSLNSSFHQLLRDTQGVTDALDPWNGKRLFLWDYFTRSFAEDPRNIVVRNVDWFLAVSSYFGRNALEARVCTDQLNPFWASVKTRFGA